MARSPTSADSRHARRDSTRVRNPAASPSPAASTGRVSRRRDLPDASACTGSSLTQSRSSRLGKSAINRGREPKHGSGRAGDKLPRRVDPNTSSSKEDPNENGPVNRRVLLTRERESSDESFWAAERNTPRLHSGCSNRLPNPRDSAARPRARKCFEERARNAKRREVSLAA